MIKILAFTTAKKFLINLQGSPLLTSHHHLSSKNTWYLLGFDYWTGTHKKKLTRKKHFGTAQEVNWSISTFHG